MTSRSWIRSRTAGLCLRLAPATAAKVAGHAYGAEAGAEVLLRAFLADRDRNAQAVRFWRAVYDGLAATCSARAAPGP